MMKRIEDLTAAERERIAPFMAVAARNGLHATHVRMPPDPVSSAGRRRQRQLKARWRKKEEAAARRLAMTGREWWHGRDAWRGGGRGGDRRRWLAEPTPYLPQECRCGRGGFGCCEDT